MDPFESFLRAECGRAEGTVRLYLRNVRLTNEWLAALGTSLDKCPPADVRAYLKSMSTAKRNARTIANRLDVIAVYWRFIGRPQSDLDGLERPRIHHSMPDVPSRKEIVALIEAATDLRDRAILELMYATGVRAEELCGMRIEDLQGEYLKVRGKGAKDRLVPVGNMARDAVSAYLFTRPNAQPDDHLFLHGPKPLSYHNLAWIVEKYARKSKQRCNVHPHTLRHCFATHMLIDGKCNPRDIQGMMGHDNLETTARYMHMQIGDIKRMHARCHPSERRARGQPMKVPCGTVAA